MIAAEGVSYSYGPNAVLSDAGLTAHPGEVIGLIGPNGSGKTTFLRTLYRSLTPDAGSIRLDGELIADFGHAEMAKRMSVVIQESDGEMPMTVAETVLLGRSPHLSPFQRHSAEDYQIAAAALARVGTRHLADRVFAGLSGGEKQRVLIARALTQQADHILLDEPTNHLDIRYQHEVLQLVRELGVTTVVVLHDLNLAARYCDHVVLLDSGRVSASGTPDEVFHPHILEPVYKIGVQRVHGDDASGRGGVQLLFTPLSERETVRSGAAAPLNETRAPIGAEESVAA